MTGDMGEAVCCLTTETLLLPQEPLWRLGPGCSALVTISLLVTSAGASAHLAVVGTSRLVPSHLQKGLWGGREPSGRGRGMFLQSLWQVRAVVVLLGAEKGRSGWIPGRWVTLRLWQWGQPHERPGALRPSGPPQVRPSP